MEKNNRTDTTKKLVLTAMLAALCTVATMVIRIPTIGTSGYVNIGDTMVLISAWILGGPLGALAAGLGSGLADLLAGYATYVPGTFVIKAAMAFAAFFVFKALKNVTFKQVGYVVSAIVAEAIMVVGYFLYEDFLLGYGIGAASSIPSNLIQGVTCLVLAVALEGALEGGKFFGRVAGIVK